MSSRIGATSAEFGQIRLAFAEFRSTHGGARTSLKKFGPTVTQQIGPYRWNLAEFWASAKFGQTLAKSAKLAQKSVKRGQTTWAAAAGPCGCAGTWVARGRQVRGIGSKRLFTQGGALI